MRTSSLYLFLAISALAQTPAPPAFDVASVKINQQFSPDNRLTWIPRIDTTPGTLTMRNVNVIIMVAWAYDVQRPQVLGPDGINTQRYDIFAKVERPAKEDEMRQMLQTLLVERFKLAVHRESRRMDAMVLVVPKGGHKMTESKVEGPVQNRQDPERGSIIEGVSLPDLLNEMSREIEIPLLDMTGLKGRFDFSFNVQKYVAALRARVVGDPHPPSDMEARVMIMQDVLAGDLGLRLEARQTAVNVVVIDHAEKSPVEN